MSRIPVSLDPFLPRALNQRWEGDYSGDDLPRLRAASAEGSKIAVHAELSVVRGVLGEIRLQGRIDGEAGQVCQRCLEPIAWRFRLEPNVALVAAGAAAGLGEDEDRVELGPDGLFWPTAFVEDEILLALPLAPRHDECGARRDREFEPGEGDRDAESPFAVLGKLRGKP
jgi:uncharacterized protein